MRLVSAPLAFRFGIDWVLARHHVQITSPGPFGFADLISEYIVASYLAATQVRSGPSSWMKVLGCRRPSAFMRLPCLSLDAV